jgi:hypothetical protein
MLAPKWQKINGRRHNCHWWQDLARRRLSAMALLLLIIVIVAAVAATMNAIARDDRGQLPPPGSRSVDPAFLPPSTLVHR